MQERLDPMVYGLKTGYNKATKKLKGQQQDKFISHSPSSLGPSCLVGHGSPRGARSPVPSGLVLCCL